MQSEAVQAYLAVKKMHAEVHLLLVKLKEFTGKCNSPGEHADMAYAMKKSVQYIEDTRKEMNYLQQLAEKIGSVIWVKNATMEPIRTKYCTTTPDITMIAALPKRGTSQYDVMMAHIGVPENLWSGKNDAIRVHWPGFVAHLSKLATEGKPLPPGIDMSKTYPKYEFKPLRGRKDVDA